MLLDDKQHWQARHAGIMALQAVCNSLSVVFLAPGMDKLLNLILPGLEVKLHS